MADPGKEIAMADTGKEIERYLPWQIRVKRSRGT
jgi:hypothetical protein